MNNNDYLSLTLDQLIRATREIQYSEDLVPAQWEALRYLSRANKYSITPGMVANFLGTTKGTASQTLRSLESKGYVKRIPSKMDKRMTNVIPTRAGLQKLDADPLGKVMQLVDADDSEENTLLLHSLERLLRLMKSHNNGCHFGYCPKCNNYQRKNGNGSAGFCTLAQEDIKNSDTQKICARFSHHSAVASSASVSLDPK